MHVLEQVGLLFNIDCACEPSDEAMLLFFWFSSNGQDLG